MFGGVVYGARAVGEEDPGLRLGVLNALLAALLAPLALAESTVALALLVALAGTMVAPAVTVEYWLIDEVAPAGTATEAMSWIITAYGIGLALGAAFAGPLVDGPGTTVAFLAAAAACGIAALIPLLRRATLSPRRAAATVASAETSA
jgi:predicted MFS family arabinose efflux permease